MNKTLAALFACAVFMAPTPSRADDLKTRFGTLTISSENVLLLRGKPVVPSVEGNSGLSFIRKFEIGTTDVILVQDTGGAACPAQFYFVTATPNEARSTPAFGTCTDQIKVGRGGDSISVTMAGFQGDGEPKAARAKAMKEQHVFKFEDGLVREVGTIRAAALPVVPPQAINGISNPGFDLPLFDQTIKLAATPRSYRQDIRCTGYKAFMVREVHEEDDVGKTASIIPITGSDRPKCQAAKEPRERELPGSMGLEGAVGRFLLLSNPDGANGAQLFAIFDATTARKIYTDNVTQPAAGSGFFHLAASPDGETLTMGYERVVVASCSLATTDPTCWSKFAGEAKLPSEIARRAPPASTCAAAYTKERLNGGDLTTPSVVSYPVTMTLTATGTTKVVSRGDLSCWPSE